MAWGRESAADSFDGSSPFEESDGYKNGRHLERDFLERAKGVTYVRWTEVLVYPRHENLGLCVVHPLSSSLLKRLNK